MLLQLSKSNESQSVDSRQLKYNFIDIEALYDDSHLELRTLIAKL